MPVDQSFSLPAEDVLAQLDRILASEEFEASERNRNFLRFVVMETLAGRQDRLKAYTVATAVMDRPDDFDPQSDPVVRIEAGKLRRALERYYLGIGHNDPILIRIPKGSYAPKLEARSSSAPAAGNSPSPLIGTGRRLRIGRPLLGASALLVLAGIALLPFAASRIQAPEPTNAATSVPATELYPTIFIPPFEAVPAESSYLAQGLREEIIGGLTRYENLSVFAADASAEPASTSGTRQPASGRRTDFVLAGRVEMADGQVRLQTALLNAADGHYLWSVSLQHPLETLHTFDLQGRIADEITGTLAEPYGVIFNEKVRASLGKSPENFTSYDCVLRFYSYWKDPSPEAHATVQGCLEQAILDDRDYAEAWASLALALVNTYRLGYSAAADDPQVIDRAEGLAERAIALAPEATSGYRALHLVLWFKGEGERSLAVARKALALNPHDTQILAELGWRTCLSGDWQTGLPLLEEALARYPGQPDWFRYPLVLRRYLDGQLPEAQRELAAINADRVVYTHVLDALIQAKLGDRERTRAALSRIAEIDPGFLVDPRSNLERRHLAPEIIDRVASDLQLAESLTAEPALKR
jgi:adenylate cyclase